MKQYQFEFHSEIIKRDIELHMYENIEGIPRLVSTCYLYDGHGSLIHGSINETKRYLTETWRYHKNRSHSKTSPSTSCGQEYCQT